MQIFDEYINLVDGFVQFNGGFCDVNLFFIGIYGFGLWIFSVNDLWNCVFGIIFFVIVIFFVWLLMCSLWGWVFKGICEDEDVVCLFGKNVFVYKMQVFVVGGIIGVVGGIVFVFLFVVVFGSYMILFMFFLWIVLLFGGVVMVFGLMLGVILFWVVFVFMVNLFFVLVKVGILLMFDSQVLMFVFIFVGIVLMLFVIFCFQGIFGDKREMIFVY